MTEPSNATLEPTTATLQALHAVLAASELDVVTVLWIPTNSAISSTILFALTTVPGDAVTESLTPLWESNAITDTLQFSQLELTTETVIPDPMHVE